jgi:hypothetical protein
MSRLFHVINSYAVPMNTLSFLGFVVISLFAILHRTPWDVFPFLCLLY